MVIQVSGRQFDLQMFRFRFLSDLQTAVANPALQVELNRYGEKFYSITVEDAAKDLEQVSPALQLAYQTSKPFPFRINLEKAAILKNCSDLRSFMVRLEAICSRCLSLLQEMNEVAEELREKASRNLPCLELVAFEIEEMKASLLG